MYSSFCLRGSTIHIRSSEWSPNIRNSCSLSSSDREASRSAVKSVNETTAPRPRPSPTEATGTARTRSARSPCCVRTTTTPDVVSPLPFNARQTGRACSASGTPCSSNGSQSRSSMRTPSGRSPRHSSSRALRLASTMRNSSSNHSMPDSSESKMRRSMSVSTRAPGRSGVELRTIGRPPTVRRPAPRRGANAARAHPPASHRSCGGGSGARR
jgi:hypothetical protein